MKSRTEILVPLAAIQAVPIAVIAWYRLHRYAWYRYSAIVSVGGAARKLGVPYIEVYEQIFTAYDKDWLDFIVGNRQGKNPAKDYDYIEGGIANDRVIDTIKFYIGRVMDETSTLRQLAFHKPNNQICILNQELINKYLEYVRTDTI